MENFSNRPIGASGGHPVVTSELSDLDRQIKRHEEEILHLRREIVGLRKEEEMLLRKEANELKRQLGEQKQKVAKPRGELPGADAKPSLLLDVTERFLSGSRQARKFHFLGNPKPTYHSILWYNIPFWLPLHNINQFKETCSYTNCHFTTDSSLIRNSSAIIFCTTVGGIGTTPPLRPVNQVWIFFGMESPTHQERLYKQFRPVWKKSLNWSMSYRLDSDIITPYGYLVTRKQVPQRNYSDIFRTKTKLAAWVVSNCHTPSLRENFVSKLRKYGLEIDIFGACGKKLEKDPLQMINSNYKFYLSFENTLCSDYITEKFFKYFTSDAVLVVRGGADYKKLLPKDTYIDTKDFSNFSHLVGYLKTLGSNEKQYVQYLKTKDKYDSVYDFHDINITFCSLCAKLNNLEENKNIYETVPTYLNTCYSPDDIDKMDIK